MFFRSISLVRHFLGCCGNGASLILVLAVTATVPILQLASLGYMLEASGRVARGLPASRCFPGAAVAGSLVACALWLGATWLPVWLVADLAYSSELIAPGSLRAQRLRLAARGLAVAWVLWSAWAIYRGGRWWHFLWPAPRQFFQTILHPESLHKAEDRLWNFVVSLQVPKLLKLGFYGTVAALLWLILPASLMIIALTSPDNRGLGVIGLAGSIGMWWVLLYLPFLQIQMAREGRFLAALDRRSIRASFRRAPFSFLLGGLALVVLAIPLYLLRIEEIPSELWWILSLFFVLLMFPAKLAVGWALRRSRVSASDRHWTVRWLAFVPMAIALGLYVGFLYLTKIAVWEGTASILLQHAFLPPVPFYVR